MNQSLASPEAWYHELGTKYVVAQILFHFNNTGVIADLAEHEPSSPQEIAKRLKLDARVLDVLLTYLANADELLTFDGENRYRFTDFGHAVLTRYSRKEKDEIFYNFHQVRVGALGTVWEALGGMLEGSLKYGVDIKRRGEYAEEGVYTLAKKFSPVLLTELQREPFDAILEIGANTGLTEQVGLQLKSADIHCLDRSTDSLKKASERYAAHVNQGAPAKWVHADFFNPSDWLAKIGPKKKLCIFSIHFHEVLAAGEDALIEVLKELRASGTKGRVLVLEQPRLEPSDRNKIAKHLWLYNHSNVLIHHLIGNGKILSQSEWVRLFEKAGCKLHSITPSGYLGYQLFVFEL